jgi:TonB family protein
MAHGGPKSLRRLAFVSPLPKFPAETLKARREGVVVVEVIVRQPSGTITDMKFLETFDKPSTDSVSAALKKWRFAPLRSREGVKSSIPFTGRLTFYFRIKNGTPAVIDAAAEMLRDEARRQRKE